MLFPGILIDNISACLILVRRFRIRQFPLLPHGQRDSRYRYGNWGYRLVLPSLWTGGVCDDACGGGVSQWLFRTISAIVRWEHRENGS